MVFAHTVEFDVFHYHYPRSRMLEYCFACSFKWILSVAGSYVDDCFRCAYRGLDKSLTLRVFSHEAQYFLIMICELFDELFIMMFFSKNNTPKVFFDDAAEMLETVGPLSTLPMLLACLGAVFTSAGVGEIISKGFQSVDEFVRVANIVLNRRKSRAGKSLEHHLSAIFDGNCIEYSSQAVTEGNKKPDFLFPSQEAYHDSGFSVDYIVSLAAKTTCKDRWRQVLNEADRLRDKPKYLCTLQQGISGAQMDEMQAENVILVVPKPYIVAYPKDRRDRIWTLARFVEYVKMIEGK